MKIKTIIKTVFGIFGLQCYGDPFQTNSVFDRENQDTAFTKNNTDCWEFKNVFIENIGSDLAMLSESTSKNFESWMDEHKAALANKKLNEIIIPGSHDSGAYIFSQESKFVELPKFLEKYRPYIDKMSGNFAWFTFVNLIKRWCKTQNLNINEQLKCGVRYFDLRISQDFNGKFYLYHGLQTVDIEEVFKILSDFLIKNRNEILVLDMSHFNNVNHEKFIALVQKYLANFCIQRSALISNCYKTLVKNNQRCCLYYDNKTYSMKYDFLLGKSDSFWTDKREIPQLKEALINYHKKVTHKNPWVLQWVLTPNAKYIAKHPLGSVEELSKSTHKELVPFLKDIKNQFPLNIIMVDFINKEVCQDIINLNFN